MLMSPNQMKIDIKLSNHMNNKVKIHSQSIIETKKEEKRGTLESEHQSERQTTKEDIDD